MPPRKRVDPKPEPPEQEPVVQTLPPADPPEEQAPVDSGQSPNPDEPPADEPKKPEKSDLRDVEQPCTECFPSGWADGAFSHGCEHGTWVRDNT